MSGIRTNAAAELLGVSPNTLRSWERRFSYPKPRRTQGGHRQYELAELESLRRALLETHNISSAIELARQRGEGPSSPEPAARRLGSLRRDARGPRSWRRASPSARSSARVEEVLLPALELADERDGREAERELALPLGHRLAARRPARGRRRRAAPRACCSSTRARGSTSSRCTCRRSSWAFAAPASARCCWPSTFRPSAWCAPSGHSTRPRSCSAAARPPSRWSAGSCTRCARWAPPRPVFEYREAMPVTGEHGIPSLGSSAGRGRGAAQGLRGQRPHRAGRGRAGGSRRGPARRRPRPRSPRRLSYEPGLRAPGRPASDCRTRSRSGADRPHARLHAAGMRARARRSARTSCAAGAGPRRGGRAPPASPRELERAGCHRRRRSPCSWCSPPPAASLELRTLRRRAGLDQGERHRGDRHARGRAASCGAGAIRPTAAPWWCT